MFKSIVRPPILVFLMIFMFVNLIYGVIHYGGSVVIPEWYIKENKSYLFEPMPVMQFIYYWINRGVIFSFVYGIIAFILTFIFTMLKYRKTKDIVLSKKG